MKFRHEEQQYLTVNDLVNENTLTNTKNDVVYCQDINRAFRWVEGSSATHDGSYVIEQTSESANGRWLAISIANVYTGTGATSQLQNGQMEEIDVNVAGAKIDKANLIAITNGDDLPSGFFVNSKEVVAADTVRVVVENQTGDVVAALTLEISVLEF